MSPHVGAEAIAAAQIASEPRLFAIARAVGRAYGVSLEQIRAAADDHQAGARDAFLWLCDQLRTGSLLAAASYIGAPLTECYAAIASVEHQRGTDPAIAEHLDGLALELHCEAAVLDRLGRTVRRFDEDPYLVSRRLLASRREAMRVPVEALQHLAAAYVSLLMSRHPEPATVRTAPAPPLPNGGGRLDEPLRAFVEAGRALGAASDRAQPAARQRFETAADTLIRAAEAHFGIKRSFR